MAGSRFLSGILLPGGNLSGHSNVFTINPGGSGRRQLTHVGTAKAAGAPDWSAGGAKIAYESNQSGDYRIWVMNADGSGQRRLTAIPASPTWSPPGRPTASASCSAGATITSASSLSCDLAVMNAAGGGMRQLASGHWTYVRGQYSPDGRRIVVGADRGGLLSALWVMRADGSGLHRITRPSLQAFWPGWSPDGRRIVFTDNCCQFGSNIWTVRPNGHGLRKLTHFGPAPLQGGFASYSPDGRRIVLQYNGKCPARGICRVLLRHERRRLRPARGAHRRGQHVPHRLGPGRLAARPRARWPGRRKQGERT